MSAKYSLLTEDRTLTLETFDAADDREAIEKARELYGAHRLRSVVLHGPRGRVASLHGDNEQVVQVFP